MAQREQTLLRRHTAELSLDQRKHALCSGKPPRHYGLLRLPRNLNAKRCRHAMLQELNFKNRDPPHFASRATSTSTEIPARTNPLQRHTAEASWATSPPAQPQRIAVLAGHVTGLDLQEPNSPTIHLPRDLNANRVYCNCHSRLSHNAHTRNAAKSLLPILFIRVLADNFFLYRLSEARNVKYCPQLHARSGLRFIMRLQEDA
jgi:hypothetical protein